MAPWNRVDWFWISGMFSAPSLQLSLLSIWIATQADYSALGEDKLQRHSQTEKV